MPLSEADEERQETWSSTISKEGKETVLPTLRKALEGRKVVEIDYTSRSSGPMMRKVDPYARGLV